MFVKVARRGLMGPSEAVLPTMVAGRCVRLRRRRGAARRARVVACVETKRFLPPGAGSAFFEEGLAAVLRGVAAFDDLGPSV